MPEPLILLSAAISPRQEYIDATRTSVPTRLTDPEIRLAQYLEAVSVWTAHARSHGAKVVVVETSGTRTDELSRQCELIGYEPSARQVAGGRGAIEAAALDYALEVLDPPEDAMLIKATGRLIVPNAFHAASGLSRGVVRARGKADRTFYDSRLIVTDVGTWRRNLTGMGQQVADESGRWLERVLAMRLMEAEVLGKLTVERFPVIPEFVGSSGTTGKRYTSRLDAVPGVRLVQRKAEGLLRRASRHFV
ncbi:hypothetical protein [Actinomyces urogenitalis]|uniref:hypothetical protein n=1 Tax=Actinomyces urogenitalis TaxID=103621 RepID=UPI0024302E6A|nr:hypothetical protein [Actinomyces urogenitalis]MCI7455845.1 hypothetical protein [Actinomyces urogenitalis]